MMPNAKRLVRPALVTLVLLAVPLIAMQFTAEVRWSPGDFVVAGALLFGTGCAYELLAGSAGSLRHKLAVAMAAGTGLLLIWVNLAVGITGAEGNPVNLLYFAVIVVGAIGAVLSRLDPIGLTRTLAATALTQALIALLIAVTGLAVGPELTKTLGVNALFVGLWTGAALLLRSAATAPRAV